MSLNRPSRLRRRLRVEADPDLALDEMEQATQRLRDQAWKINAVTRNPLIPDEALQQTPSAAESRR